MRIVFYAPGWPPARFPNGIVTALDRLAPAIRERGADAAILAFKGEMDAADHAYSVADAAPMQSRSAPRRALRRLLSQTPDIYRDPPERIARAIAATPALAGADIVEMEESFGWSGDVAARLSMPVITRLHGPWFLNGAALSGAPLTRDGLERVRREGAAIAAAEAVSAPSRFVLDAVRNHYGIALDDAAVIANPAPRVADSEQWNAAAADPDEILFVGRFDRHKGADIVLRAFAALAPARPHLKLTFAGPNDKAISIDGRAYTHTDYVQTIMPADAAARVNFLGPVPAASLGALRRRAFATVIASRVETFGNVVVEALAFGSPLVAAAAGAIPEIARDKESALLTPAEDADAMARALASFLDDRDMAARLGAGGRARITRDFAASSLAAASLDFYETVRAQRAAGKQRKAG